MMMPELKISDGSTLGCFVEDLYLLTHHHYKILCLKKVPRLSNQYQTFKMSYTYYKKVDYWVGIPKTYFVYFVQVSSFNTY